MTSQPPTLLWLRRDLRIADHPALQAAIDRGGPVIPVFIRDESIDKLGAAPKWRLGLSLEALDQSLADRKSALMLRTGDALGCLRSLVQETGAKAIYWSRLYDPDAIARDTAVKTALAADGIEAKSFPGHVLFEPWTVETGSGGYYRVYSPMWRAVKDRDVLAPLKAPSAIPAPLAWPESEALPAWELGRSMKRGAKVCRQYQRVGEQAALDRLNWFVEHAIADYGTDRDLPGKDGCSGLSENLALGEISVRMCWHAALAAHHRGHSGAEKWLKELVWREFAYHLLFHTPHIATQSWREGWDRFPWNPEEDRPEVLAWKQGRTGIAFVDAAMRELYVTGKMHNRARMIVGSYLTKHMLTHWRIGQRWFEDCLTDWDPASNAMGWQWVAGSGPDAAPYFRIFNPDTQAEKFDQDGAYRHRWIAEGRDRPTKTSLQFFEAIPCSWHLSPHDIYPPPVVALGEGRARALAAYEGRDF